MPGIVHEIRHGARRLLHSPAYALFAMIVLGLGLGATLFMFTVLKANMLTPLLTRRETASCTSRVQIPC